MVTAAMNLEAVGSRSEPYEVTWTAGEAALYAVAIGAGHDDPESDLHLTAGDAVGVAPQVAPTFCLWPGQQGVTRRLSIGTFERSALVHAEQSLSMPEPLAPSGRGVATARLEGIHDKRSGALVRIAIEVVDPGSGTLLWTSRLGYFVRGAGGFGGEPFAASPWAAAERPADMMLQAATWPGQALMYRLTGDRNPLHCDPEYARRAGFKRPILHGLCTYGLVARTLLANLAEGDQGRFRAMDARFSNPVYPGDPVTIEVWGEPDGYSFRASGPDGDLLLDRGRLLLG